MFKRLLKWLKNLDLKFKKNCSKKDKLLNFYFRKSC